MDLGCGDPTRRGQTAGPRDPGPHTFGCQSHVVHDHGLCRILREGCRPCARPSDLRASGSRSGSSPARTGGSASANAGGSTPRHFPSLVEGDFAARGPTGLLEGARMERVETQEMETGADEKKSCISTDDRDQNATMIQKNMEISAEDGLHKSKSEQSRQEVFQGVGAMGSCRRAFLPC